MEAIMQGSEGREVGNMQGSSAERPAWRSVVPTDVDSAIETYHLQEACERVASASWRAVCNGNGRVDTNARKVFNAGCKAAGNPEHTGDVVDAVAASIERRAKRAGKYTLRVDGTEYVVERLN